MYIGKKREKRRDFLTFEKRKKIPKGGQDRKRNEEKVVLKRRNLFFDIFNTKK